MVVRVEYDPSTGYAYERQVIGLSMQPPEGGQAPLVPRWRWQ